MRFPQIPIGWLVAISVALSTAFFFIQIALLKLPPYRSPYAIQILGLAVWNFLALKFERDGNTVLAYVTVVFLIFLSGAAFIEVLGKLLKAGAGAHP